MFDLSPIKLRKLAPNEEIDYVFLKSVLGDYKNPRAKITSLLRSKVLIRVKKGLYIFGPDYALKPYCKEILANIIYGPSYLSLEYALSFYGFIPERVEVLTSVTNKKDKSFNTPIGVFSYRYLHPGKYSIGMTQVMIELNRFILIATPEKALLDKMILESPSLQLNNKKDVENFLFNDLRISREKIKTLKPLLFNKIANVYQDKNIFQVNKYLKVLRKK